MIIVDDGSYRGKKSKEVRYTSDKSFCVVFHTHTNIRDCDDPIDEYHLIVAEEVK